MRIGVAHHLGWAVVVTASKDFQVVDRRRVELVDRGLPAAPVHHAGGPHALHPGEYVDDGRLEELVEQVRVSAKRMAAAAFDELAAVVSAPITSVSLRAWPQDFPEDLAVLRHAPYESHADSVMYRQVLADLAHHRRWDIHLYDAKTVESEAVSLLGHRAHLVLYGPRQQLGPPWNRDHRTALAATVLAGST